MLPEQEWLSHAKRCAIGQTMRLKHRNERRPNMTVGNNRGNWWAYCNACKEGGRMDKEHVLLGGPAEPVQGHSGAVLPSDMVTVQGSDYEAAVHGFLASKGMVPVLLPKLYVSPSARRVLMQDVWGQWHGRDVTGRSDAKWLHYGAPAIASARSVENALFCVVTEDIFSAWKVAYAMRPFLCDVWSTLGAGIGDKAALALRGQRQLVWAYDADKAGDDGFKNGSKKMRAFVRQQYRARPPEGLDPKDMDIQDIRDMIERSLSGV